MLRRYDYATTHRADSRAKYLSVTAADPTAVGNNAQNRLSWNKLGHTYDGDPDPPTNANAITGYTIHWKSSRDASD